MKTLHLLITVSLLWAGSNGAAQSAEKPSDDVAIIIGNKTYQDEDIPEVSFAHNDAMAMRHFAQDILKIHPDNIIYLEDATQAKMQSTFGRRGNPRGKAFQYVKPDVSNLYVFYSGHGIPGQYDRKSYLLPVDAEIETAEINGYPTDILYENLAQIDAKSVTVFLDACFSGSSHGGVLIKNASGAQILPAAKTDTGNSKDTLTVVTAASQDQLASWDEENQHGLFTEYLLRALYGDADVDKDGVVKLDEVKAYLFEDMRYKARRTYNRDQKPTVIGNGNKVLAAATGGTFPERPEIEPSIPVIDTSLEDLIPVEQNMFAMKNANVRAEPDVRSQKVNMIPKGEPIHVAAKVADKPWYAIEMGDEIIGYIFQDLLGEEKEIATEEENQAIRELKARLEKLEERTRLSSDKNILPSPPEPKQDGESKEIVIVERGSGTSDYGPADQDYDPYVKVEKTLKQMGAILARQNFIDREEETGLQTSLRYNWIRIDAERCTITASLSLRHNGDRARPIDIHDHRVEAAFWKNHKGKKRVFRTKDRLGDVVKETILYQYGPYGFKNRKDRRLFKKQAERLGPFCMNIRQANAELQGFEPPRYRQPSPPPRFGRPPPPPRRR